MPKATAVASKAARDSRHDARAQASFVATLVADLARQKEESRRLREKLSHLLRGDPRRKRTFEHMYFCGTPDDYPKCRGHDSWDGGPDCDGMG